MVLNLRVIKKVYYLLFLAVPIILLSCKANQSDLYAHLSADLPIYIPKTWNIDTASLAEPEVIISNSGNVHVVSNDAYTIRLNYVETMQPDTFYEVSFVFNCSNYKFSDDDVSFALLGSQKFDYNGEVVVGELDWKDTGESHITRIVKSNKDGIVAFSLKIEREKDIMNRDFIIPAPTICPADSLNKYTVIKSDKGTVRMIVLSSDIMGIVSIKMLQKWINLYEEMRCDIKWFVGDKEPYNGKTDFVLTERFPYYGLAGDPIYINQAFVADDFKSIVLAEEPSDCNLLWPYLHEMSHTFDGIESKDFFGAWNFDPEFFATLKATYALGVHGYGIENDGYCGDNIAEHFKNMDTLKNGVYSSDGLIYTLLTKLNNYDGNAWEHLKNAILLTEEYKEISSSVDEKFAVFWKSLGQELELAPESLLSSNEWYSLSRKYNYS